MCAPKPHSQATFWQSATNQQECNIQTLNLPHQWREGTNDISATPRNTVNSSKGRLLTGDATTALNCLCQSCMGQATKASSTRTGVCFNDGCSCISSSISQPNSTTPSAVSASFCGYNSCVAQKGLSNLENRSSFSLKSTDLQYGNKLQQLAMQENQMERQIQEIVAREQRYSESLRQADQTWASMEEGYQKQLFGVKESGDMSRLKCEKMNEQLKGENLRLSAELRDIRLELKHCMENVEGPLNRQLNKERKRCRKLETDLACTCKAMTDKEIAYANEINNMQSQMDCICTNLTELKSTNKQLKRHMGIMESKYKQLQQDVIAQKISEARTFERLQEARCMHRAFGRAEA